MRRSLPVLPALVLALTAPVLAACGGDDDTTVTVYAAASLKATFEQLADDFEADHEGVTVELVFGGSSDLVSQITNGAEADVFASADEANMDKLPTEDRGEDPQLFATNTLEIVTPPDNPAGVASLQDLAAPGLDLVLCAPEVPCGAAAEKVGEVAGLTFSPVSEEQSVTDVLGKITSGQGDAGLVYVTDVTAAGDSVLGIEFPESGDVVNNYPITTIAGSDESQLASDFVDLVLSPEGQQVLTEAGFGAP